MASVINTNISSLNAQRNLSGSQGSLNTSLERLSSGLRINGAKDDAAGLAIASRFTSQINGLNQAVRNANDGISLAQTAEGDLNQVGNNLQRIRQLASQSANATNSGTDRVALQKEATALTSEIDRVAKNSNFNGINLLDGTFTSKLFQVGADAGQTIAIDSTVNAKANSLGKAQFANDVNASVSAVAASAAADVTVSGLTINGITIADVTFERGTTANENRDTLMAAINAKTGETGVIAETNGAGSYTLRSIKSDKDLAITTTDADSGLAVGTTSAAAGAEVFLAGLNISTAVGAQRALEIADKALTSVNTARADLGAIQNRFTSVVSSLQTTSENLSASRSRIQDTDFAQETANLTRSQILQQAGTAMLAQANSLPNNVMSLLQG